MQKMLIQWTNVKYIKVQEICSSKLLAKEYMLDYVIEKSVWSCQKLLSCTFKNSEWDPLIGVSLYSSQYKNTFYLSFFSNFPQPLLPLQQIPLRNIDCTDTTNCAQTVLSLWNHISQAALQFDHIPHWVISGCDVSSPGLYVPSFSSALLLYRNGDIQRAEQTTTWKSPIPLT